MTVIFALWLPILLSAVVVFVLSSIIHMVLSWWHASDYPKMEQEAKFMDAVRPLAILPGDYMVPRAGNMEEMRKPEFLEKMKQGPVVMMTVLPSGPPAMGKPLAQWFLYCLVVSAFAGYIAGRTLPPGTDYMKVFHIVSVTALIGYSLALWQFSIWYRRAWLTTIKATVDGVIYALFTAGVFGWLWPH
jgi:hypothetical protein